jgi:hypothetical protein
MGLFQSPCSKNLGFLPHNFQLIYSNEYGRNGGNGGHDGDAHVHGHGNVPHHHNRHVHDGGDVSLEQEALLGKFLQ